MKPLTATSQQYIRTLAVFALILVPMPHNGVNVPSLHGQAISKGLKQAIKEIEEAVGKRVFESALKFVISFFFPHFYFLSYDSFFLSHQQGGNSCKR